MGPSNVRTENVTALTPSRQRIPLQWGRPMLGRKTAAPANFSDLAITGFNGAVQC